MQRVIWCRTPGGLTENALCAVDGSVAPSARSVAYTVSTAVGGHWQQPLQNCHSILFDCLVTTWVTVQSVSTKVHQAAISSLRFSNKSVRR